MHLINSLRWGLLGLGQFNDIENWVESAYGGKEMKLICPVAYSADNRKWAKPLVREFTRWSSSSDITEVQVNHITGLVVWGWCSFLIVVLCHVVFRLGQCCLGFLKSVFHPVFELVDRLQVGLSEIGFKSHMRLAASVKKERAVLSGGVDMIVVLEFHQGE